MIKVNIGSGNLLNASLHHDSIKIAITRQFKMVVRIFDSWVEQATKNFHQSNRGFHLARAQNYLLHRLHQAIA